MSVANVLSSPYSACVYRTASESLVLARSAAGAGPSDTVNDMLRYAARAAKLLEHIVSVCAVELVPQTVQLGMRKAEPS